MSVRIRRDVPAAFTLVELLVVLGILAALIGALLPALAKAREQGNRAKCLANLRSMEVAQTLYAAENHGFLVQAGFAHGGVHAAPEVAWFNVLQRYGSNKLLPRCPSDFSPHWEGEGGLPVSGSGPTAQYRLTSYGINDFVAGGLSVGNLYYKITQVPRTSLTIQFLEMAYVGEFAGADHPHSGGWSATNPVNSAAQQLQIAAHGGLQPVAGRPTRAIHRQAMANYGFLDGHAETLRFDDVYRSRAQNKFDPDVAQ